MFTVYYFQLITKKNSTTYCLLIHRNCKRDDKINSKVNDKDASLLWKLSDLLCDKMEDDCLNRLDCWIAKVWLISTN